MPYEITWSPTAKITYYQVLDYLNEEWTFREIENFIDRTEEALTHISQNPLLYSYSKENDTLQVCTCETSKFVLPTKIRKN